jgi:hypothetical protein
MTTPNMITPYVTIPAAAAELGMLENTARRIAKRLGLVRQILGRSAILRDDLPRLAAGRLERGNPRWKESGEAAAAASLAAVDSRNRRRAAEGETAAERRRNRQLGANNRRRAKKTRTAKRSPRS